MKYNKNNIIGLVFTFKKEKRKWLIKKRIGIKYHIYNYKIDSYQSSYSLHKVLHYLNNNIWIVVLKPPILNTSYGRLKVLFL